MSEGIGSRSGPVPTAVRQEGAAGLRIEWSDGHTSLYGVRELRLACPCAQCVDERTGVRRLDEASVPASVRPVRIVSVGRYAVQIVWNDLHQTGIYTFELLRRLCPCPSCEAARPPRPPDRSGARG